ncbi:Hypothetical predicted protein [Mytilus galloprovincialis]|uniref:Uncharacterized protein n=1 Tax=Mytilus galloprovincialis TaxID=29158 RepID=A0A8B6HSE2_MYTGA|nr:Hypothetical predicted protein [Mytilus galloprovincialis]
MLILPRHEEDVSDPEPAVPNHFSLRDCLSLSVPQMCPTELRNPTADESSSRSNVNEATGSAHFDSVGGNNMAAIMQSFSIVSQSAAQCASGLQQTVSLIANQKCTESSSSKKFDLAQWYHNRNAEDAPLIGNGAIQSRQTPPSLGYSSITPGKTGVRSDSSSNVDIVAPSVQRNIIEVQVESPSSRSSSSSNLQSVDKQGRSRVFHEGREMCNNFNNPKGCYRKVCYLLHQCTKCRATGHGAATCRKSNNVPVHSSTSSMSSKGNKSEKTNSG